MKKIVSITIILQLILCMFSTTSFAATQNLSIDEFYNQVKEIVLEFDYIDSGLSGSVEDYNTHRLIVKTKTNEPLKNYYSAAAIVEGYDGLHILQYSNGNLAENAYNSLLQDDIEYVEYDFYIDINDEASAKGTESVTQTFQLSRSSQTHISWNSGAVNLDEAFDYIKNSNKEMLDITVAVIDSGIFAKHSDFSNSGRIIDSKFTYDISIKNSDGSSYILEQSSMEDVYYHGTHVSGIIFHNTMDNVYINPYRVTNEKKVLYSYLNYAFEKAIEKNPDIINISIANTERNDNKEIKENQWEQLYNLVSSATNKGIIVVAGSGNRYGTASKYYPACHPNVITVAASTEENIPADFSNKGLIVDVAAPGTNIKSTSPTASPGEPFVSASSKYFVDSGTSMAAPLVTAAAATLKSIHPEYTPAEIQRVIKETAYVPEGWDTDYGTGIVNFLNMVKAEVTEVKPTISIKNGKIVMTAPEGSDSRIYYTLDGTVPTIDNPLTYTEPIDIDGMNIDTITAVCHENGKLIGEPVAFKTTIRIDLDTLYFRHTTNPMPKEISSMADWRSSNPNIASVDCKGNITGVSPGTTYVYANRDDGVKMVYKVTVDYSLWQEILIKLFFGFLWYI